jgi:2-phosphoglycerate kinase
MKEDCRNSMPRIVILIGGAPTVGKSTMAQLLSHRLSLPWISTDQIREVMQTVADEAQHPKLFNAGHTEAETFLNAYMPEQIADMELEQGEAVWAGVIKFIENDYTWKDGFIMEGVGILPKLVATIQDNDVKSIFLIDRNEERMKNVIYARGLWGDADTYPDYLKEKEVHWATLFSHKLEKEARRYGLSVVEVEKNSQTDLAKVCELLGL